MAIARYSVGESSHAANLKLLYVTYSKYEHDWNSILHAHPFTEFIYVTAGKGQFRVEKQTYPLKMHDFVIVNPNTAHTEMSLDDSPLEYVILGIEGPSFSFEGEKSHIIFSCANDKQDLMFYMNTMLKELEEKEPDSEQICQNLLEVLIIKLIRRTNFAIEITPSVKISKECLKLKRYMETNFAQNISLDDLSDLSHLNKYYLVHIFKKKFGCSPISYLSQIRIQASKELLTSTDLSIAEIAQITGFSSQSYFAQCFQKSCGMSALAYRRLG